MSAISILKKEPPKKTQVSHFFLKGRYFIIGGPINVNVGVFCETSLNFLKIQMFSFATFPKI